MPRSATGVYEWFRRRGLTMLLSGTPLARSTSERATPALIVCFLLAMWSAATLTSLDLWLALIISTLVVAATWIVANIGRGRPPLAPVKAIGWIERAAFVLAPTLVVAAAADVADFGDTMTDPVTDKVIYVSIIAVAQVLLLFAVLGLERLGIVTLSAWLGRTLLASFAQTGSALATSLPVSLGVVFFFFLNPGVWGSIGMLTPTPYMAVIALLLVLAGAFLGSQRHLGLESLTTFETVEEYRDALAGTPLGASGVGASEDADTAAAEGVAADAVKAGGAVEAGGAAQAGPTASELEVPVTCPMGPLQKFYVRQVAVLSQLVVSLVIATAVFCLFVVIGYLAVDPGTAAAWTRAQPLALVKYAGSGHTYVITDAHLRVAGFLAAFVAFNYSLASATDGRLRQNSKETASQAIRQACAMRIALLRGATA